MSKIKFALVSFSTVAFVLCLGLFSARATSWAAPAAAPAAEATAAPETARSTPPANDERCKASVDSDDAAQSLVPADAICGPGFSWTVCRCGGAGCRPTNISPTNWCAC